MVQHSAIDHTGVPGVSSGSVATDSIWDAAGDLAVGSGANTAARLAIGTSGQVLASNGTTATWSRPGYVGAKAFNNAVQSVGTGNAAILTLDSEDFDSGTIHSTSANTGRLVAPVTGKYLVTGRTFFPFTASTKKYLAILKNAAAASDTPIMRVGGSLTASEDTIDICAVLSLTATDYLELTLEHDNGSSQNAGHATARRVQTEFSMTLLGV